MGRKRLDEDKNRFVVSCGNSVALFLFALTSITNQYFLVKLRFKIYFVCLDVCTV